MYKKFLNILSIIFLFVIIGITISCPDDSIESSEKNKEIELTREDTLKSQFNVWDGSHKKLTQFIKNNMNDPESFNHVKTLYWDKGKYLIILTTYRGKNLFGGTVTESLKVKVDMDGNIIEIIE